MKYIKKYEDSENISDSIRVGDILYCINSGVGAELEIGQKYTVDQISSDSGPFCHIFRLAETGSRWLPFRFTKDPNHPILVKYNADKYNL